MINVSNVAILELLDEMKIAETLSAKEKLTSQEERQYSTSLAKISLLKQGVSSHDIALAKIERLQKELGLPVGSERSVPENAELRAAWTAFVGGRFHEVRTNFQATSEYGQVTGLTQSGSGSFVPPDYDKRLFSSLAAVDEILADGNCNVVETLTGAAMTTPAIDDVSGSPLVSVASVRVDEANQSTNGFVRAGSVRWGAAPTYRSGIIYCATELEQDSAFALLNLLELAFNRRHALGFGRDVISGDGTESSDGVSGVPYGLLTALPSVTNITAANVLTGNFIDDLVRLFFTLPVQYRRGAKFYMSSSMALQVAHELENVNRSTGTSNGFDKLFNRDVVICESMPTATAGNANAIVFANPNYLLVRHVKNASYIRRFTQSQNAIEAGLIGFESFFRADARPMVFDSVQPPVASLNLHS
jgi:HK97 family phage major capsid protein